MPTPPRFVGRRVVQALIIVVVIGAAYYAVSLWQVWSIKSSFRYKKLVKSIPKVRRDPFVLVMGIQMNAKKKKKFQS